MFNFFRKKREEILIKSPIKGTIVNLKNVEDPVFSGEVLGKGLAIKPNEKGEIVAPIDGVITQLFDTKHAFIVSNDNVSIMVHFGLDTVNLKGEGFKALKKENDSVKAGDAIISFDYDLIVDKVPSLVSPVIVLESDTYSEINILKSENDLVNYKDEIIKLVK